MADEKVYGWVLLPVAVDPGYEDNPKTYEFENDHAYFEDLGGDIEFLADGPGVDILRVMRGMQGEGVKHRMRG